MKKPLIILDVFLILLVLVLGLALFHSVREQSREQALSNIAEVENNPIENKKEVKTTGIKINTKEIKDENFLTLSGLWKNTSTKEQTKSAVVSGPSITIDEIQYELILAGVSAENDLPYLKLKGEGQASGRFLGIYPQGSAIPVKLADGSVDYAGQYDSTDKRKDRIILFDEDYLSAQDVVEQVFYRDLDEIL